MSQTARPNPLSTLGRLIFLSRWLQAPLYFGLIVAQEVYFYQFILDFIHLVQKVGILDEARVEVGH